MIAPPKFKREILHVEVKSKDLKMIAGVALFCIVACIFIIEPLRDFVLLHLFYKPLYFWFSGYFYFPFFLHVGFCLGLLCVFMTALYFTHFCKRADAEKLKTIQFAFYSIIIAAWIFLGRNTIFDFWAVCNHEYLVTECRIENLYKTYHSSSNGRSIRYSVSNQLNGKYNRIDLNLYQYQDMLVLKKKSTDCNKLIKVFYLPNTKIMLKYEILE